MIHRLGSTRPGRLATRIGAVVAACILLPACSGGSAAAPGASSGSASSGQKVKLVWWHNFNTEPGLGFMKQVEADFEKAYPNVDLVQTPMQSEDMKAKLRVALQSNNPPDVIHQWGGGQMKEQVQAGKLADLTAATSSWIGQLGSSAGNWQLDGKTYGVPFSVGAVGFWYRKDLFIKAGIANPPATYDELIADAAKLRAAGIEPIAVGGKDKWPVAFWYDYLAVRACSPDVLKGTVKTLKFDDPCYLDAAKQFKKVIDAAPFNKGFLGTSAQQGAGSSAGLVANGKAAMELMGQWNPGVMQGLTADQKALPDSVLGWFPFPAVPGLNGSADGVLGGGDGYSCAAKAPKECADFLKFFTSAEVQTKLATTVPGQLPTNSGAVSAVTNANDKAVVAARDKATFYQVYLDVAFGSSVGDALNEAVTNQLAGKATPEQAVKAIQDAAANA